MDAHGYTLTSNSKTSSPDYIPSLVGVSTDINPNSSRDVYFDRVDLPNHTITSLSLSRWVSIDDNDPILGVKFGTRSYYIPAAELHELATANDDTETLEMLGALAKRRYA